MESVARNAVSADGPGTKTIPRNRREIVRLADAKTGGKLRILDNLQQDSKT